ncbi:hypothetical protein [Reyranella sp. CPCC 100927]|uniref:hypothetical protein n=1 Tax=Reyranella sp. CPCC 100927 TaxID=2599616 RepID=UPI0011B71387|nr:hypothetical protein [Reyranella sp. CPCC 100927]TWT00304.1 hypothetical protein FQU96_33810 [Reyranella sp. CPCC 100927]
MSPTEERLFKLEIRMAATEYLVANLYAAMFGQTTDPVREAKVANDTLRDNLRRQTVPGTDPVWSDHVSGEMQDAMERVLLMMEDMTACLVHGEGSATATVEIPPRRSPMNA